MLEGFSFQLRQGRPIKVGLTGSLASGKSTVLKVFKKKGWRALSADDLVAEIYREKKITKDWILKKFGKTESGMRRLEKWIHPLVKAKVLRALKDSKGPIIVEVPLLYEAKFDRYFDLTIAIYAPKADRLRRVMKRGMSKDLFLFLDKRQFSARKKAQSSDFVLHNYEKEDLKRQTSYLADFLAGLSKAQ